MSLTFKIGSLVIRTLAKPLSNYIKRNATEHERFRRICVSFAQSLHRIDMRLRLGLLQDPAAIERQIQRELKEAEKKRQRDAAPTVKTEAQVKEEQKMRSKERTTIEAEVKAARKPPPIRPLSESKAIETGANFISETFLFLVAGALIFAETWRRNTKDKKQDEDVANQLDKAEKERNEMKEKLELLQAEIEALMDKKPFDSQRAAAVASIKQMSLSPASPQATQGTPAVEAVKVQSKDQTSTLKSSREQLKEQATVKPPVEISSTSAQTVRKDEEDAAPSSPLASWLPKGWLGESGKKSGGS